MIYYQQEWEEMEKGNFKVKAFLLDLRIQVMPINALFELALRLKRLGLNTLVVEWEASYPYRKHTTISNTYAYDRTEVERFIRYCHRRGIDVIPLQQCFGHIEYILQHDRYAHLREESRDVSQISQLCPLKKKSALDLFTDLFDDIISLHPSMYVHIGGDETYLLGHCPDCRKEAAKNGKSGLYVDYMGEIARMIVNKGKRPVLWADMLLRYPEAASQMPAECIFVDWNYGWAPERFGDVQKFMDCGFELWGALALRCHPDNSCYTSWDIHLNNIRDFIPYCRKRGYTGIIMASWSTSGLYGFECEKDYTRIQDIFPIRRVYPLPGLFMLLDAYSESLKFTTALNPKSFVKRYAQEHFGMTAIEGENLYKVLLQQSKPIDHDASITPLLKETRESLVIINSMKPKRNKREFSHIKLMTALRCHYIKFKAVERQCQSSRFTEKQRSENKTDSVKRKLRALLKESKILDMRFRRLNTGFLYPTEIEEENLYRNKKLKRLMARIMRTGRKRTRINY